MPALVRRSYVSCLSTGVFVLSLGLLCCTGARADAPGTAPGPGQSASQLAKLCASQTQIVKNTMSLSGARASPETVQELQRLSAIYDRTAGMKGLDRQLLAACHDDTAALLRDLATAWRKEAAAPEGSISGYALAAALYKEYIQHFPHETDRYQMHYSYGEVLSKLGMLDGTPANHWYCDAALIYTQVVKMDPKGDRLKDAAHAAVRSWTDCLDVDDPDPPGRPAWSRPKRSAAEQLSPKGDRLKDAAHAAVRSWKDCLDLDDPDPPKRPAAEELSPKPIPPKQQKMLEAYGMYIQYVPESAELASIKYRSARVLYEYNHFQEALPLFRDIVQNHSQSEVAILSTPTLLNCMSVLKDYDGLEQQVERFLGMPKLWAQDQDFRRVLEKLKLCCLRHKLERFLDQGDHEQAGILYMQLAERYPNDPKIEEIYFNAGFEFSKAHLPARAIEAWDKLIRVKPQSFLARRVLYRIGQIRQELAEYEEAARIYESFATQYPGEINDKEFDPTWKVDAALALYTAAIFRRGLGQDDQAGKDVDQYLKNYGGRKAFFDQAAGLFFDQGQIYDSQKDYARLRGHLNRYLKDWAVKGGVDRRIVAEVKLGEIAWRQSCPVAGENDLCITVTRERVDGVAQVAGHNGRDRAPLRQRGPETTRARTTVRQRDPAQTREAMAHFQRALSLYRSPYGAEVFLSPRGDAPPFRENRGRSALVQSYVALALLRQGDQEFESYLRPRPHLATGQVSDEDQQRQIQSWATAESALRDQARRKYEAIARMDAPAWTIAAMARIGQLFVHFPDGLYGLGIPGLGVQDRDREAAESLSAYLRQAVELNAFDQWSALCEAELHRLNPKEFPLAWEIRAEPGYAAVPLDVATLRGSPNPYWR